MDRNKKGVILSQLSRFLFDSAANKFYGALLLEFVAGCTGILASLVATDDKGQLVSALVGFFFLLVSYLLKIQFENEYDRSETMRRQSVLSEGLGWRIGEVQFSDWKQRAGSKILARLKKDARPADFYATQEDIGPRKLLEMTRESAFYTRYLYHKFYWLLGIIMLISFGLFGVVLLVLLPLQLFSASTQLIVAYVVYIMLPLVFSSDILSWFLKLGRMKSEFVRMEEALEQLEQEENVQEGDVLRLVMEYNCQLVGGLPIPKVLFSRWHEEISESWENK